ncbi:MAG: pyridoxal phosphate-dependent aminotransferase, partial [Candidatus Eisenbacteria bacterium]|nr:pyridoxal phosphate-dependent aminotransferase [Candidatus Eisenbacteria bacterium]
MKISRFASKVGLSETGAVDELVRARKREGLEVYNFGVGQPDFPTPESACEAGIRAIREQKTRYTSPMGTIELRQAIAEKMRREQGLEYDPAGEILVSSGAKHSIHNMLAAVLSPGEEVLLPTPAWVSYPSMVALLGGEPRYVETALEDRFKMAAEKLRAAITPRTVGLILNSPCNPTGAVYAPEELRALAAVILEKKLWVVADEIYEKILFDGRRHAGLVTVEPALRESVAVVSGVSKTYSMTGWRIGYAAGPKDWIQAASAIQSHQAGNPCSVSQEAVRHALHACDEEAEAMRRAFERRRDLVMRLLEGVPGLELFRPEGTFYLFPRIVGLLDPAGPVSYTHLTLPT